MINKATLIGNVGQDPEVRTAGSNQVASFTLATSERYNDKNGQPVTSTEWHRIEVWGKLAEITQKYVHKGSKLYLEGKIKTDMYETNGGKKYVTKIVCHTLKMLDSKPSNASD
ncbi:MAG: single-stranded DNA-binding protein [Bacteroidales bacterium]|jgi:single-strand DNA-binding protein|nr:single-stranded DNA-binding protein [Bacteroidales bacterium]